MIKNEILKELKTRLVQTNKMSPTFYNSFRQASSTIPLTSLIDEDFIELNSLYELFSIQSFQFQFKKFHDEAKNKRSDELKKQSQSILRKGKSLEEEKNIKPHYIGIFYIEGIIDEKDANVFRAPLVLIPIKIEMRGNNLLFEPSLSSALLNNSILFALANSKNISWKFEDLHEEFFGQDFNMLAYLKKIVSLTGWNLDQKSFNEFDLNSIKRPVASSKRNYQNNLIEEKGAIVGGDIIFSNYTSLGIYDIASSSIYSAFNTLEEGDGEDFLNELVHSEIDVVTSRKYEWKEPHIKTISELDYSQKNSIAIALKESIHIQGPPGTGKSQTIVNLLANLINNKRKSIFVTEKKVAGDVVYERMGNLKNFCLKLNGKNNRKEVFKQVKKICEDVRTRLNYQRTFQSKNYAQMVESEFEKIKEYKKLFMTDMGKAYLESIKKLQVDSSLNQNFVNLFRGNLKLANLILELMKSELWDDVNELLMFINSLHQKLFENKKIQNLFLSDRDSRINYFYNLEMKNKFSLKPGLFQKNKIKKYFDDEIKKTSFLKIELFLKKYQIEEIKLVFQIREIISSEINLFTEMKNNLLELFCRIFEFNNLQIITKVESNQNKKIMKLMSSKVNEDAKSIYHNYIEYICEVIENKKYISKANTKTSLKTLFNKLFKHISDVKTAMIIKTYFKTYKEIMDLFFPVLMCTPESISHTAYFPLKRNEFDYVIFDEASQIYFERCVPALYRAKKHIIVGDEKQLSPTNFFKEKISEQNYDEEQLEAVESQEEFSFLNYKSLLDYAKAKYPTVMLNYHYRSLFGELINFSNFKFYDGNLNVVGSNISKARPIRVIDVDGRFINGVNRVEAEKIVWLVEQVLERQEYKNKSIGIITFNSQQQKLITQLLEKAAENNMVLYEELNKSGTNSLFIKNIENVQGDERDIIIFSFAFAKRADGRFINNFGPAAQDGGEKRLNVAVSRAKHEILLVKSISSSMINSKTFAGNILKDYLAYAETVSEKRITSEAKENLLNTILLKDTDQRINQDELEERFDSEFEIEVYDEISKFLDKSRYKIFTQVKSGGFFIDLAIFNTDTKKYVLAIECDGYTYHSSEFDRTRDFERQCYLENRGWTFERILSTHWWAKDAVNRNEFLDSIKNRLKLV